MDSRTEMAPRSRVILAALAAAEGASHTPVQVQKLLFLIDEQVPEAVGGKQFDFQPYHYGPFDRAVYRELELLESSGFVATVGTGSWRSFALTDQGQRVGRAALGALEPRAQKFFRDASAFVRSLSFSTLVSSIYKAYPRMAVNSVFRS